MTKTNDSTRGIAARVLGGLFAVGAVGCGPTQPPNCHAGSYYSVTARSCVGLQDYMRANDGAFPDGFDPGEAGVDDVIEAGMDVVVRDASDAAIDAREAGVDGGPDSAPDADASAADVLQCEGGQSACSSGCVDTSGDILNCGACGNACPTALNGSPVCSAGRCDLRCDAGTHRCGNMCLRDDDVASCGTRCVACAEPAGGRATCAMAMCGYTCNAGFEDVGGTCEVAVARPLFPPGTSTVTMLRPTLKWALPTGVDGAQIELCRDRACTMLIERINATGATARPTADLPRSTVVFWRLRGRVGTTTGSRTSATWQFRTPARSATTADTAYGTELDVNGDGFTDVAVGVRGANGGNGAVRFFYGSATGPSITVSREIAGTFGTGSGFGKVVVPIGDVDGDGFGDVAFSAAGSSPSGRMAAGQVLAYRGSSIGVSSAAPTVFEGVSSRDQFGLFLSAAGDVNGDGYGDVIVGAPQFNLSGLSGIGECTVFYGSAAGLTPLGAASLPGAYVVTGAIDVDGDQLSDVAVGHLEVESSARPFNGAAFVLLGRRSGISTTPQRVLLGGAGGDRFGFVSSAGDVNGDGFSDVAIGSVTSSPMGISEAGTVELFPGGVGGTGPSSIWTITGTTALDHVGSSAALAGDANGDGFSDLLVAVPTRTVRAMTSTGVVSIYAGSATGPTASPRVLEGSEAGGLFGSSVAGCGDVNGDGFSDVIVGAPVASPGGVMNAGTAMVFRGGASGVELAALRSYFGREVNDRLGIGVGMNW